MEHSISTANFDLTISNKVYLIEINTELLYGTYTHKRLGDKLSGQLWFELNDKDEMELVDFDGADMLPQDAIECLEKAGFNMDTFR
jgi:hypothetical protein